VWAIGRTALTLSSLLMILAIMLPSASYVLAQQFKVGALVFHLELYDERGRPITILGALSKPVELEVFAQVYAITPPDDPGVLKEVYKGRVRGLTLRLEARGVLRDVAEGWVRFEERRGPVSRDSERAVQLNLWIVNRTSGEVVQRVSYYYTYSPKGILEGEERAYKVKIAVPKKAKGAGGSEIRAQQDCTPFYYWERAYTITPDTYVQAGKPSEVFNYLRWYNGAWYIKTPLLTVNNTVPTHSSPVLASIAHDILSVITFDVSIGIGFEVEKKLRNKIDIFGGLSGEVYRGGPSWKETVYFGRIIYVYPGEEVYVWIWARPVFAFYREHVVDCLGDSLTGKEKVEFFVQDAITIYVSELQAYTFHGDYTKGPLPGFIRGWIFNDTLTEKIYSAFTLDPSDPARKAVTLAALIRSYYDTCTAGFEVPVGIAIAASAIFFPELAPFVTLLVVISPSLSYSESETVYVNGVIEVKGSIRESLDIYRSKLSYRRDPPWWCLWCDTCYYKVPVSLYIESQ